MNIGILKPDHLGDLVLAAPAIAALQRTYGSATLFCHPNSAGLAAHLFPGLSIVPILFPHLDKVRNHHLEPGVPGMPEPVSAMEKMQAFDRVFCLRWDGEIEPILLEYGVTFVGPGKALNDQHAAVENRQTIEKFVGHYDIFTSYRHPDAMDLAARPAAVRRIGLCISAGFRLNSWPMTHWLALAERFAKDGMQVTFIGGPAEATRLEILRGAFHDATGQTAEVLAGGRDFSAFLRAVAQGVDLIVATDSGSAHLVSLVRPMISLFGGSPWKRFAPIGKFNAVLSRRYRCSPCMQFNRRAINSCTAQECLNNLFPEQVHGCVGAYLNGLDFSRDVKLGDVWIAQAPFRIENTMIESCVIFDFDGVIADTERQHLIGYNQAFQAHADKVGGPIVITPEAYFTKYIVYSNRDGFFNMLRDHGVAASDGLLTLLCAAKDELLDRQLHKFSEPLPGVRNVLAWLEEWNVPRAICSGARRDEIIHLLDTFQLRSHFDVIVAIEDVRVGKPDPEGYNKAFELLSDEYDGMPRKEKSLVIEDSAGGCAAAQAAGLRVLGVATSLPLQRVQGAADFAVPDLSHVKPDDLRRWLGV